MPELPELQAHAERLDRDFAGAALDRFMAISPTVIKTAAPSPDVARRHPVAFIGRRGLHILVDVGVVTFVVGIAPSGRLDVEPTDLGPHTVPLARWTFADGRVWLLTDTGAGEAAGVWVVTGDPERQEPLVGVGPDANDVSPHQLLDLLHARPMSLNGFLRDQHTIAGLGPRLSAEVCHRARLSPFAVTTDLAADDAERLIEAIHACVNEALADERGRDRMTSSEDRPGHIYRRPGGSCPVCGDTIRSVEVGAETVAYCPTCQTGGRLLPKDAAAVAPGSAHPRG